MAIPVQKYAHFQNINISYTNYNLPNRTGKPTLVFIHGWCCSSALWASNAPLYTAHPSIRIDLPGHGESDKPENVDYSTDFFARAVNAVLEAEDVREVVLIGHSLGGFISTMVLRLFGEEKVKGIVYVASFFLPPAHYLSAPQRAAWKDGLADDGNFFGIFRGAWTEKSTPAIREQVRKTMVDETPKYVRLNAGCTDSLAHHWRWDEIYAKTPMLHIRPSTALEWDEQHRRHLPNLVTERWEGVSVFLFMEDGGRFNGRVELFLEEHGLV